MKVKPDDSVNINDGESVIPAETKPKLPRIKGGKTKREREREERKLLRLSEPKKPTKKELLKEERAKRKLEKLEKQKQPREPRKRSKPEQCEVCGFISRSLRMHMLTHTQERNFECDFCGKKFTLRASLKNHIFAHINIR